MGLTGPGRRRNRQAAARHAWQRWGLSVLVAAATVLGLGEASSAQSIDTQVRIEAPRVAPARPRARPTNPRDRAYMDGGVPSMPSFSGFPAQTPAAPQAELAPRPNIDLEYRPRQIDPPNVATISPTIINPQLPGRGAAATGAINQREQRFLENPAAGARFSVPMSW